MVKKKTGRRMILITVHMTEQQVKLLDKLVEDKVFPNRSEAIRYAIRLLLDYWLHKRTQEEFDMALA